MLVQDVGNAVATERLSVPVHEDVLLIVSVPDFAKPAQCLGRLPPQGQQSLFSALAAQSHLTRWRQLEIAPADADELAHAGAAVVEEQQQRVVAPPLGGAPVRLG